MTSFVLKVALNVLGAALVGYGATETVDGALVAVGTALVGLFQKAPSNKKESK